jgi:hypothetical protein
MHSVVSLDPSGLVGAGLVGLVGLKGHAQRRQLGPVGDQARIKGQGQNEMQRAGRSISPRFPRGLTTLVGRVQSIRNPDRPGSRGVSFSLRNQCSKIRGNSTPRQGNRMAIARCEPRFWTLSSHGTTLQVDQATHTEAFANFAQLRAADRVASRCQPLFFVLTQAIGTPPTPGGQT